MTSVFSLISSFFSFLAFQRARRKLERRRDILEDTFLRVYDENQDRSNESTLVIVKKKKKRKV